MKLYRAKVPTIAHDTIAALLRDDDIEVEGPNVEEAEADLVAIMEEFMRRDSDFRNRIKDEMSNRGIPYDRYGEVRKRMSEEMDHPVGDDIERFLCRQFIECLMISRFVEEVYADDRVLHRKIMEVLRGHHVDEREIREEAASRIKNIAEGTVEYEIAMQKAVKEAKVRRGLIAEKRPRRQ